VAVVGNQRPDQGGIVLAGRARHILPIASEDIELRMRRGADRRAAERREQDHRGEASFHDTLFASSKQCARGSQTRAPSTLPTISPGSAGGRRSMITGMPRSRAAMIFASVAAPPLALQTSTSILWRSMWLRSSANENGPRAAITS